MSDLPRYDAILFDLDGTLSDPYEGITSSILHALDRLGAPAPVERLDWCIGPPLQQSLATLLGSDDPALIERGIGFYRERFAELGILQQEMYPCAADCLHRLRNRTRSTILLATSKPRVYAERILATLGIAASFHACYGAELDGRRSDKGELIAHIIDAERLDPARAVMVGDRKHDVIGARRNGMPTIGVTYGYGGRDELLEAGADELCDDIPSLQALLLSRARPAG